MNDIDNAIFGIVRDIPTLCADRRAIDRATRSCSSNEETRLYDFLAATREMYGRLPHEIVLAYEAAMDPQEWLGAIAWRLFRTETDDLNEAVEVVELTAAFLGDLHAMGVPASDAVDLLTAAIDEDLRSAER